MSDFAPHIATVAKAVWGDPNGRLSSAAELRFGTNGSRSVDLKKGTWFDHETSEGGGVLALLEKEKGLTNGKAFEFLRGLGLPFEKPEPAKAIAPAAHARIVAEYDYVDEEGELLFQVVRMEPKTFRQRKPESGGWSWGVKGVRLVPYRLPELVEAAAHERTVYIVEGEKDVDALIALGVPATCNPMGAGKWPVEFSAFFRGLDVVILPDNDEAGRKHRDLVAANLSGAARSVRVLDLPGLPDKGDASDWLANGGSLAELDRLVTTHAHKAGEEPFRSRYGALWLHELANATTNMAWVIKGVVPAKSFGGIVGEPGCGKSFLSLDMAFTTGVLARTEAQWFGHRVHHGGVVYLAAEGQSGFIKRVKALMNRHKVAPDPSLPFVLLPTAVDLRSAEGDTDGLIVEIKAHAARMAAPLSLIFVDTLNRAMGGGDENSSEDMGAFIRACDKIREATGATVVVVHHLNASGTRERGHTSFRGALDFMLTVNKGEMGNAWTITKQKDGEDGADFGFALRSVTVGVDDDGDNITSCVVEAADQPNDAARKPGRKLPDSAVVAYRALVDCCNDQGRRVPISGLNMSGVPIEAWWDFMKRNQPPGTLDDTYRKTFKRAQEALQVANRIGVRDSWVWPVLGGGQ
jgi:hypothetical protein